MKKYEGTDREAYVGKDITIKIPKDVRMRFEHFKKEVLENLMKGNYERVLLFFKFRENCLVFHGFFACIKPIIENIREVRNTVTLAGISVPTVFSLGGLVNFQLTAEDIDLDNNEVFITMCNLFGYIDTHEAGHTFENPANYGVFRNEVRFRDTGGISFNEVAHRNKKDLRKALKGLTDLNNQKRK